MLTDDLLTVTWTTVSIALSLYAFHRWDRRSTAAGR